MDLEETGIHARNWVDSAQDRDYWRALVNAALNLRVPKVMELIRHCQLKKEVTTKMSTQNVRNYFHIVDHIPIILGDIADKKPKEDVPDRM
jgi:hypothetical protein